jgi:hypothetical protein
MRGSIRRNRFLLNFRYEEILTSFFFSLLLSTFKCNFSFDLAALGSNLYRMGIGLLLILVRNNLV